MKNSRRGSGKGGRSDRAVGGRRRGSKGIQEKGEVLLGVEERQREGQAAVERAQAEEV